MKHVISETHSSEMWSELRSLKDRLSEIGLHIVKIKIRIFSWGPYLSAKAVVWDDADKASAKEAE